MLISCQFFSCEVIRDWKTGESLCYAFIEFEKVRFVVVLDVDSAYQGSFSVYYHERRTVKSSSVG